jgi:hypothetical protein
LYSLIRLLIAGAITITLFFLICKKTHYGKAKSIILSIVAGLIVFCILNAIPIDSKIVNFESPEALLHYTNPSIQIERTIEKDDFAAVFTTKDHFALNCFIIRKEEGSWQMISPETKKIKSDNLSSAPLCSVFIVEKSAEEIFVLISEHQTTSKNGSVAIKDTQSTAFDTIKTRVNIPEFGDLYNIYHYAFVNSNIGEYNLYVNDDLIKLPA